LPDGTVTFLFTDLEGSTRLLAAHPAAYRDAVARHHDLLRQTVEAHGGAVFETVGDAVYAAFARPTDAVAAALAGQRALLAADWGELGAGALKARMGLHTGEVERRGAHYFGTPLYRCARFMATAHGGQTVLSGATAELVRGALPAGAALRDLGAHRLKDLREPERVFQLAHPALLAGFPPLRTLDALPQNLPAQVTSFVGREGELAEAARLLAGTRLLTLTGTGGTGKTRLALQLGAALLGVYPDGVWFVDLAPLADAALVPATALAALGTAALPGQPAEARLLEHLRPWRALLLLDNCEHVLAAAARLADAVVRHCPGVRVLATSRELLGLAGETAWRVPSLALPPPDEVLDAAALEQAEAVRLFVDRARAVQPAFALTAANAPAVAEVCRRLDGIPLALELAAARVRVLTPAQLAARLGDSFRLLTGGGRTALRRQQTLRATVDWSHDLLAEPERALFRRLAVFPGGAAGGFPLEAAEAVGADGAGAPVEAGEVLDLLTGLVDKSLVLAEAREEAQRYRLLETLRQYAEERLLQAGEAAAVRDRHAAWCVDLGRAAAAAVAVGASPFSNPARQRLRDELENARAALTWCAADPAAAPAGLELLADAGQGGVGETASESRRWLERFLGLAPARTAARARCLLLLDHFLRWEHEFPRAAGAAREAREIFEALGDADGAARAASCEGLVAANLGDYDRGGALITAALARARERGDWRLVEQCARELGMVAVARRDLPTARAHIEESRTLAERHEVGPLAALALLRLASIDRLEGDYPRARARLEGLRRSDALIGGPGGVAGSQDLLALELGSLARAEGRHDEARAHLHGALRRLRRRGEGTLLRSAACLAGLLEVARGAPARGVTLLAACARGEGPLGTVHMPEVRAEAPGFLERARQALGEAGYAAAWAQGQALTLEQAVACALDEAPDAPAPA
jgi:predicted ATPase/class 3 adenylate cyclase